MSHSLQHELDRQFKQLFSDSQVLEYFLNSPRKNKRDNIQAIFRYPAMMLPSVQEMLLRIVLEIDPKIKTLFDPYVGAGTSITAGMMYNLDCYGQDINPLAVLISRVKTGPLYHKALTKHACSTIQMAKQDNDNTIESDFTGLDKWFKPDVAIELSKLRRAIRAIDQLYARRFLWVILAETIRLTSNDRVSTYKLHARPKDKILARQLSPIETFTKYTKQALEDLLQFKKRLQEVNSISSRGCYRANTDISLTDTSLKVMLKPRSADLIMTSPPYGDNHTTITYGQHSYLPLQWIDLIDIDHKVDTSYISTTQEIDRRSLGGVSITDIESQLNILKSKSSTLNTTFDLLQDANKNDKVGKVVSFYHDFENTLDNIIPVLKDDGYMIWTIGNRHVGGIEIKNDQILTELLTNRNMTLLVDVTRQIKDKRMPYRNRTSKLMSKERILIFRRSNK